MSYLRFYSDKSTDRNMSNQVDITAGIYKRICACKNAKAQKRKNVKAQMYVYAFTQLFTCV